jgi:diaminopimelate decarboxylase
MKRLGDMVTAATVKHKSWAGDVAMLRREQTPVRVFRAEMARERLDALVRLRDLLGRPPLTVTAAFSLKTNPRAELLELARERGFFAEVISADELRWAVRSGYAADRTIYNGPQPLLAGSGPLAFVFADSLEAFERNFARGVAQVYGVRLRPSMLESRFGVPVEDDAALSEVLARLPDGTPIAVSFHARREDFHGADWRDVAADVVERALALQTSSGRRVHAFDVGGGWTPDELDTTFASDAGWLIDRIARSLPLCTQLILEPGQAVCTPSEALIATVVEVRRRGVRCEVVIDAGYPDWPQMHSYPHGFFAERGGRWEAVGSGPDRLLGRTCLEYDVIPGLRFPPDVSPGDRILITDTGSYDHSMAFDFAHGDVHAAPSE